MNEEQFFSQREPDWQRLAFLCDRADASPANLGPQELREFVRLYRRVSTDLALVRTKSVNVELADFLNALCGRAYGQLYRTPRRGLWEALGGAIGEAARTVRRRAVFVGLSAAIVLASAFFAAGLMRTVPATRPYFISEDMQALVDSWRSGKFEERSASGSVAMAGFYGSHNPLVAIMSGAIAAATFGVGTTWLLYANGTVVGALGSEMADAGKLGHLLVSIAPHGVTEMSGMIVSGAAGFCMGWALIAPGRKKRGQALQEAGRDAVVLLATSVVMMFIAAPIEAFFSFNPSVPVPLKALFAGVSAVAWFFFWTGYRRSAEAQAPSA